MFVVFSYMAIDKNAVIKEAQKFAAKGQFDKAIAEWKKLVKEAPNDANLYNTIGDLCLKKNSKPEAVEAYNKAADILAEDGFTSKAIALYKKVLNIDPQKIEAHLALADLNAAKGLTGNALESYKIVADYYTKHDQKAKTLGIYQKMADLNPSNVVFRIKLADMYVKEGLKKQAAVAYLAAADAHMSKEAFQDARHLFEKVLALEPDNKEVYHKAGTVYFKEGKFSEACKALKPAFEHDPANQELVDLYLEALTKAGRGADAEEVYKKLLAQDAGRMDLREKLFHLYLSKKDFGKALSEATQIADAKFGSDEPEAAEGILKELVLHAVEDIAVRRGLSDYYVKINRRADAARELLQAAELLIERADTGAAKDLLARAVELSPDLTEAKQLLASLTEPLTPEPQPEPESLEFAPPEPTPTEELYEQPIIEAPVAPEEVLDPAIVEAFTEADVLIKYGLTPKAMEQLEALSRTFTESPQVRIKLRDMYRAQGNLDKALSHTLVIAELYEKKGRQDQAEAELRSALEMAPGNAAIMARLGLAPAPEVEEQPAEAPVAEAFPHEAPGLDVQFGEFELPPHETPSAGEAPAFFEEPAPSYETPPFEVPGEEIPERPAAPAVGAVRPSPPAPEREELPPVPQPEEDINEIWAEAEFYYQQGLFDEARKHYARIIQLNPDDRRALDRIVEISREKAEVQEFSKLAEAVEGLEGLLPAGEFPAEDMATSISDEEAVRTLMEEIQALKKTEQPAPPPPSLEEIITFQPTHTAPATGERPQAAEENFFDIGAELRGGPQREVPPAELSSGDEFFDLASELRDELNTMPAAPQPAVGEEQSLDDIFEEFKKGVEEQVSKEDVDTHYNLGVAYKEMGLLDDAISEFSMTPENEPRFIQSRYMLGLCYLEKGEYQNTVTEIQGALTLSYNLGEAGQERIGMHYDLGLAYQGAGNTDGAIREFQKVHDMDPGYREVATKLQEGSQGDFISLDELKADIEKEISSKFFEEGERIEREEKHKKSEKVKADPA